MEADVEALGERTRRRKVALPRPEVGSEAEAAIAAATSDGAVATPAMLSREVLADFQLRDAFCQSVFGVLEGKGLPEDQDLAVHLMMCREMYMREDDGLLVHLAVSKPKQGKMLLQWVVPSALRPLVLRLGHDDASAGHGGSAATLLYIAERFYWPGMGTDVKLYVTSCMECQKRKAARSNKHAQIMVAPQHIFQRMHIDFLEASIRSDAGHKYILTVVDARSGYVWLYATKDKASATVADILYDLFLDLASLPETLISDQGGEFVAAIIQDLCRLFRVAKMETSSYHPQANGVAERTNRKILETLQMWVTEAQRGWHKGLKMVEYSLRLRPRAETGLSPFFCVHGREAGLPMDTLIRTERRGDMVRDIQERIDMMEMAERVIDAAYGVRQKRIDTLNEAVKRPVSFAEGDLVMIEQQPEQGRGKKLDPSYDGPWQLMRSDRTGLSFSARMMGRRVRHTIAHVSNMKPYHHRPALAVGRPASGCMPSSRRSRWRSWRQTRRFTPSTIAWPARTARGSTSG